MQFNRYEIDLIRIVNEVREQGNKGLLIAKQYWFHNKLHYFEILISIDEMQKSQIIPLGSTFFHPDLNYKYFYPALLHYLFLINKTEIEPVLDYNLLKVKDNKRFILNLSKDFKKVSYHYTALIDFNIRKSLIIDWMKRNQIAKKVFHHDFYYVTATQLSHIKQSEEFTSLFESKATLGQFINFISLNTQINKVIRINTSRILLCDFLFRIPLKKEEMAKPAYFGKNLKNKFEYYDKKKKKYSLLTEKSIKDAYKRIDYINTYDDNRILLNIFPPNIY